MSTIARNMFKMLQEHQDLCRLEERYFKRTGNCNRYFNAIYALERDIRETASNLLAGYY